MKRLTEPELMEDETQVLAYANADFSVAHDHFITLIKGQLVADRMPETVLELGCGPGGYNATVCACLSTLCHRCC